jgi:hypothetical protein
LAGWLTNGLQLVQALVQNGVTASPVPLTNIQDTIDLVPVDTQLASGANPQTVGANAFQLACSAMGLINNTATSTVHTATLNTSSGMMVTEALTTAAGATYTFQLVNSLIVSTTTPAPFVQVKGGTNTAGTPQVTSITNAAGTSTVVITNVGTAAFNGTLLLGFHT